MKLHSRYRFQDDPASVLTTCYEFDTQDEARASGLIDDPRRTTCFRSSGKCYVGGHFESAKRKIIAVDFDGCLVVNAFPKIGAEIPETVRRLKEEQRNGARVILWTCRRSDNLTAAIEWCGQRGIYLDAVNENPPDIIEAFGGDTRKVFANEYWDDRAVRMP
jgi:hypothetical protein